MARALSVADGKGEVSWVASQVMSWDGRDSRGKRAAWLSGPEKSRQWRQEFVGADTGAAVAEELSILGFDALRAARSGRESFGIGGGPVPSI